MASTSWFFFWGGLRGAGSHAGGRTITGVLVNVNSPMTYLCFYSRANYSDLLAISAVHIQRH